MASTSSTKANAPAARTRNSKARVIVAHRDRSDDHDEIQDVDMPAVKSAKSRKTASVADPSLGHNPDILAVVKNLQDSNYIPRQQALAQKYIDQTRKLVEQTQADLKQLAQTYMKDPTVHTANDKADEDESQDWNDIERQIAEWDTSFQQQRKGESEALKQLEMCMNDLFAENEAWTEIEKRVESRSTSGQKAFKQFKKALQNEMAQAGDIQELYKKAGPVMYKHIQKLARA